MNYFKVLIAIIFSVPVIALGPEQGTYVNPNPHQFESCDVQDLVQLAGCCNDVLSKLDDCKANDLACECCALQSMNKECYGLCQGNPSANFLSSLYEDCTSLNDVNACSLPFKKSDTMPVERQRKQQTLDDIDSIKLKSRLNNSKTEGKEIDKGMNGEYDEEDGVEEAEKNELFLELEKTGQKEESTSLNTNKLQANKMSLSENKNDTNVTQPMLNNSLVNFNLTSKSNKINAIDLIALSILPFLW